MRGKLNGDGGSLYPKTGIQWVKLDREESSGVIDAFIGQIYIRVIFKMCAVLINKVNTTPNCHMHLKL